MNLIIHCHKQSRGGYILYNNWTLSHIRWNGGVKRYDVTVATKLTATTITVTTTTTNWKILEKREKKFQIGVYEILHAYAPTYARMVHASLFLFLKSNQVKLQ